MTGWLSTHVLDTANGRPAVGIPVSIFALHNSERQLIRSDITNADGRTDTPLLGRGEMAVGWYEIVFSVADYLARADNKPEGNFLGVVPIRFHIDDAHQHYHVPLLVSPYAYSTYKGS